MGSRTEIPSSRPAPRRLRRWLIGLSIVAVLLAAYAIALHRLTAEIGQGVESSLRAAPGIEDHHHLPAE